MVWIYLLSLSLSLSLCYVIIGHIEGYISQQTLNRVVSHLNKQNICI